MKIQSLRYEDLSTGWKLDLIEFNSQLTLLVGASGVGKTQILKALLDLKQISEGCIFSKAVKWEIKFKTSSGHDCKWLGSFNTLKERDYKLGEYYFDINNEQLFIDNKKIIHRDIDGIIFNENKTVKLSQEKSVVFLLKEEDEIKDINEDIKKIIFNDNSLNKTIDNVISYFKYSKEIEPKNEEITLKSIRSRNNDIAIKLFFLYKSKIELFNEIVNVFIDAFPYIEKVKVELIRLNEDFDVFSFIQIKEKNISDWIEDYKMSSGMWKTLMQLAELYLCADNSVILIDEFENSLGINCIDEVTYQILASERDLQFIITSHHPYIINKIPYQDWKLVTRKGSVVQAKNATDYGIGKSRLQAFTQLGNLPEFSAGIES